MRFQRLAWRLDSGEPARITARVRSGSRHSAATTTAARRLPRRGVVSFFHRGDQFSVEAGVRCAEEVADLPGQQRFAADQDATVGQLANLMLRFGSGARCVPQRRGARCRRCESRSRCHT